VSRVSRRCANGPMAVAVALAVVATSSSLLAQSDQSRHWEWGYGTYGTSADERNVAVFDWSFIQFGSVVDNFGRTMDGPQIVDRANRILALNPDHKFVVLFWPLFPVRNSSPQFSLFDYLYNEDAHNRLNRRIREQAAFVQKIRNPKSVVAMTFLEELPGHVTSEPYANNFNRPLTDLVDNAEAITRELGRPFDRERDRKWWGRRYCDALAAIHTEMKKCLPQASVFYWPVERYYTLDHVGKNLPEKRVLPFSMRQILRGGLCEGIFGYVNTSAKFQQQTLAIAERYNVPYFTQLSLPAYMTIAGYETCRQVALARHRLNLGTFLFIQDEVGDGRDTSRSYKPYLPLNQSEVLRAFCHDHQVNRSVVENNIVPPRVHIVCDLAGAQPGDELTLQTVIHNPRDASWFGRDGKQAALKNLSISLPRIPRGMSVIGTRRQPVPRLNGQALAVLAWKVRFEDAWRGYKPGTLSAVLTHDRLKPITARLVGPTSGEVGGSVHLRHNRATWVHVPRGGQVGGRWQLEMRAHSRIENPRWQVGPAKLGFRGELDQGDTLTVGPGRKATLLPGNMLHRRDSLEGRSGRDAEITATSYVAWGTQKYQVEKGRRYEVAITGRVAGGARESLLVQYLGKGGNWNNLYSSVTAFRNKLTAGHSTPRAVIRVPEVDGKSVFIRLLLYNEARKGTIVLRSAEIKKAGGAQDVTRQIEGAWAAPCRGPVLVQYADETRAFAAYWRARIVLRHIKSPN